MNNNIYQFYAARLYINPKYGEHVGPRRVNAAMFNGSLELPGHQISKLWFDLADLDHLSQTLAAERNKEEVWELAKLLGYRGDPDNFFAGQLKLVKPMKFMRGLVVMNSRTREGYVLVDPENADEAICEHVVFSHCTKEKGDKRSPDFVATNYDLNSGRQTEEAVQKPLSNAEEILRNMGARAA